MNKLTKLLSVFVIAGAMAGTGAALSGCGHKHTFSGDWYNEDPDQHWHVATCEHTEERSGVADHDWESDQDTTCNTCGYVRTITPGGTENPTTKYSITYVINGHGVAPANVAEAEKLPATLPVLTEDGWTFGGWYTDAGLNTAAVAGATLTANTTLYAKWTKNQGGTPVTKYSITYVINGHGTAPANLTEVTALPATLPELTEAGWTFGGWYTDNDTFQNEAVAGAALTANTTLYAKWTQNGGDTVTVSGVTVTAAGGATALKVNETLALTATVTVTPDEAANKGVTWQITSGSAFATVSDKGVVTGVAEGTVTVTATSVKDNTKTGAITLTVQSAGQVITPPEGNNDNAIVTAYEGEAEGPKAGVQEFTSKFLADDMPKGALAEAYNNGVTSIPAGTNLRDQKDSTGKYTNSVQNGVISINVPVAGKLKIYFSSGSSTIGGASYKIANPDGTSDTQKVNAAAKELQLLEINAVPGTYVFSKAGGTINTYAVELVYSTEGKPIKEIEVSDAGTTDYLVTQKLDCTKVELLAKDEGGATYHVDLKNCKFDTSKYNPNASGEYEIGVTYYLASNLDSEIKQFSATYKVKVYMVDSVKLSTIGLASNKQVTVQQAYLPGGTFNKENLSVIATCKLGNATIEQKLKADWYSVSTPTLTAEGKQTVTVSVNTDYTTGNKSVTASYDVIVKAKKDVVDNKVEITVGETGEFATLTQAVQYLKACAYENGVNKVIKLQAGTYTEKIWLDMDNVTLIGSGDKADDTVLTYSLVEGDADALSNALWALNCATLHVTGANFKAYNLAIRNDFDYIANNKNYSGTQAAQGVALTLEGDGNVIYNCHLYGNQDTLYMKSGRTYFYKTQIDGNIDFIFGGEKSLAFFEECDVVAIDRENKESDNPQNGYVTAPQHKEATKPDYGYVFYKCNMTDDGKVNAGSMSLGRPWGPKATVSYIECKFSAAYSQEASDGSHKIHRWNNWDTNILAENADYSEYGSMNADGAPIMTEAVKGGKILTAEQAANYTKTNIFGTNNGKVGYGTAFDCDAAYANLRILAGLDEGVVPEDPTKTYDLIGFTGGQLQGDNGIAEYLGIKIDATNGKFNVRTTNGDVQINTGTILKVPMNGRYKVILTDNKSASVMPGDDYSVEYVTEEGQLYAKITITKTGSFYAKSIMVDGTVEMPETAYCTVAFDLNYTGGGTEAPSSQTVISGYKVAKPADPVREGWTFNYWYAGDDDSVEYDFSATVTAALTLKAKWTEGATVLEPELVSAEKSWNFGKLGSGAAITEAVNGEKIVDGLLVNGSFSSNGSGWYSIAKDTTIQIKVAAGYKVIFTVYTGTNKFTVKIGDGEATTAEVTASVGASGNSAIVVDAQAAETVITLTCTGGDYIGAIQVVPAE